MGCFVHPTLETAVVESWYSNNYSERSEPCLFQRTKKLGFPGGAVVENPPANAGDTGSSPGLGRSHMTRSN